MDKENIIDEIILPENGSVVIIDDQPEEALPIIRVLSKHGISTTYYKGNSESDLPAVPKQFIRLVFLDLQLIETSDEHQIAKSITNTLLRIITKKNGPYILIIWSKNYSKYGQEVEEEINKLSHLKPACIIRFNKRDCLNEIQLHNVDRAAIWEKVIGRIASRFEEEDQEAIHTALDSALEDEFRVEFQAKPDAIKIIEAHIKAELKKAGVFHLFVLWESLVKKASSSIINSISSAIETNDLWEQNMRNIIKRMAKAQSGENILTNEMTIKAALTTFTYSFSEEIETAIREVSFPSELNLSTDSLIAKKIEGHIYTLREVRAEKDELKFKIFKNADDISTSVKKEKLHSLMEMAKATDKSAVAEIIGIYEKIPYIINTKLHLEINPAQVLVPGNIYFINIDEEKKKKYILTYFDKVPEILADFQFLELEVSPICDYAQTKWKKSRLIPGILFPCANRPKSNMDHLYLVKPVLLLKNQPSRLIFDFHLFKSLDIQTVQDRKVEFRLKREILLDIITNLSGQINRPGISFVD